VQHESVEEDDMHCMHDGPFEESQLEVHAEPVVEGDEQLYLGKPLMRSRQMYRQLAGW